MRTWQPERAVEIVAGTAPGGGLDRTARALAKAIEAAHALEVPVAVKNVPAEAWRSELERNAWTPSYLSGPALQRSLEREREEMAATLAELGLLRLDAAYSGRKTTERNV
jgi:tripartite-type tricarboxylate transporter receptor subunit TctC